jgi:hypothetical protein
LCKPNIFIFNLYFNFNFSIFCRINYNFIFFYLIVFRLLFTSHFSLIFLCIFLLLHQNFIYCVCFNLSFSIFFLYLSTSELFLFNCQNFCTLTLLLRVLDITTFRVNFNLKTQVLSPFQNSMFPLYIKVFLFLRL